MSLVKQSIRTLYTNKNAFFIFDLLTNYLRLHNPIIHQIYE